jgi:hypothetical protein
MTSDCGDYIGQHKRRNDRILENLTDDVATSTGDQIGSGRDQLGQQKSDNLVVVEPYFACRKSLM